MRRKMHDRVGPRQHTGQRTRVEHVTFDQFKTSGKELVPCAKIVENNDFVASALQCSGRMTADISRPAYDQNDHVISLSYP
jgi:hypothetical protein